MTIQASEKTLDILNALLPHFTVGLADGVSNRVGLLRGYGNAIVPQVGAVFVQAVMEILG